MSGGLCLVTLTGGLLAALPADVVLLSWTHSVERTEWREEWRIDDSRLHLSRAWVKGGGAGMEPGPGARLVGGWWEWRPDLPPQQRITLAASAFTADHELCVGADCRPLAAWTGIRDESVAVEPCP